MHFAPVRPPRIGGSLTTTAIRLKSLPPPRERPLPSFPDPATNDGEESISLHDGDFEEIATRRPAAVDSSLVLYAVYEGARPGELVLRALGPDESPPEGVTVARIKRVNLAPISRLRPFVRRR
jgi:hypothetical protein